MPNCVLSKRGISTRVEQCIHPANEGQCFISSKMAENVHNNTYTCPVGNFKKSGRTHPGDGIIVAPMLTVLT